MKITEHFLTKNDCYTGGRTIVPKGVMVHSTGVAQPDVNVFLKTWNRPDYDACVHAFVSTEGVFQTLPWNRRAWHAGKSAKGKISANNTHISFEICEPKGHTYVGGTMIGYDGAKNAAYFAKIYQNAVDLTAMLCEKYKLDPLADGVVICHSEGYRRGIASNHADVEHWFPKHGKTMDSFRADVAQAMKGEDDMTEAEVQKLVAETVKRAIGDYEDAVTAARPRVYTSAAMVPQWAKKLVEDAIKRGIIQGDGTGKLNLTDSDLKALSMVMAATEVKP